MSFFLSVVCALQLRVGHKNRKHWYENTIFVLTLMMCYYLSIAKYVLFSHIFYCDMKVNNIDIPADLKKSYIFLPMGPTHGVEAPWTVADVVVEYGAIPSIPRASEVFANIPVAPMRPDYRHSGSSIVILPSES